MPKISEGESFEFAELKPQENTENPEKISKLDEK